MSTLIDILTTFSRARLRRNIKRKTRVAQETLVTLRNEKARALQHGATTFAQFADIGIYLVIASVDLTALLARQLLDHDPAIKNVYSRHLILVIYEVVDKAHVLFGRSLRAAVKQLPDGRRHMADWNGLSATISQIKRDHADEFYSIRNVVVAHRDMNGDKQLEALESIDHKTIRQLALELELWISQATGLLSRLMNDYSLSRLQIGEIAEKIKAASRALPR